MKATTDRSPFTAIDPASTLARNAFRWFGNVCCWTSPWNYQAQSPQYDEFGNFNYGATGTALGIPAPILVGAAGLKKNFDFWSKGQSNPYSSQPHTNAPSKTRAIMNGIQYARAGCS
jgi:hypothetical protein